MRRWKLTDKPDSVKFKKQNPFVHERITDFSQVPDDQRKVFLKVKKFVSDLIGDTRCYAFGSRINGNWVEHSDYDILIQAQPSPHIKLILLRKDFGAKVDIRYIADVQACKMVEIK